MERHRPHTDPRPPANQAQTNANTKVKTRPRAKNAHMTQTETPSLDSVEDLDMSLRSAMGASLRVKERSGVKRIAVVLARPSLVMA